MRDNTIDDKTFKKVEGILYRYYKKKKELENIRYRIKILNEEIENIDKRLRDTDVTVIDYYKSSEISERVQTSTSNCGYGEQQLIKEIEKLENIKIEMRRKIAKLIGKEVEINIFIRPIERNIEDLGDKEKKFLELKYGKCLPILEIYRQTCDQFNLEQASYYNSLRNKIVENIAHWMNLIK
ncbi:hypothetical protein [Clostridium butyricum]|uniref:hypothetical protein n=1 Tax=Clostridium butyricum TaxID=1492 RepID=UPI0009043CA7|nr:hypothetical protein [Clostridium butyricum]APF21031.1 hypothetical protein NPD4_3535 [Clostridium butyricum]